MNTIGGKSEFVIFENYYTAENSYKYAVPSLTLQSKDDDLSKRLRELTKTDFKEGKFYDCLEKYTESLRHATFNGREYAYALANRSATYFAINNYKNCLIDINLSLQGDFPIKLKPKMFIRKAKCYIKMGNFKKMLETIQDCCNHMQLYSDIPKNDKDNYMNELNTLMDIRQIEIEELPSEEATWTPEVILEENPLNANVSAAIMLQYNKNTGTDYVAARDILRGEVLFVEEAYSVGNMVDCKNDSAGIFVCDYCLNEAKNCIPCKICVNFVYCSENCLKKSWNEYHQWECDIFRSNHLAGDICLPLRTLIKAASSGIIFEIAYNQSTQPCESSKDINPYLAIYNLPVDFESVGTKCSKLLNKCCEQAVFLVEFLKLSNFFTCLISASSWKKDYPTLVSFVGGLLIKHIVQVYQRSIMLNCALSIVSVKDNQWDLELLFERSKKFHAFCPAVSGVKFACAANTSTYFNGRTCIMRACKNIKAGDQIFRSGLNLTPMVPLFVRQPILHDNDINCDCTSCKDINNNIDILDAFLCIECGRFAVYQLLPPSMVCNYCKCSTSVEAIKSMVDIAIGRAMAGVNYSVHDNIYLNRRLVIYKTLKKYVNQNHTNLYDLYKELLSIYSKQGNLWEFKEALQNFKTCAESRNGRFDPYGYVIDLAIICQACFAYIQYNRRILQKQEFLEMLQYFSDVVREAKEIAEFTFPPFLRIFAPMEVYITKFHVAYVSLKEG